LHDSEARILWQVAWSRYFEYNKRFAISLIRLTGFPRRTPRELISGSTTVFPTKSESIPVILASSPQLETGISGKQGSYIGFYFRHGGKNDKDRRNGCISVVRNARYAAVCFQWPRGF
jgi:hypothetical protein